MQRMADVWKTMNKIRASAFRVGLNLWDWYRPLDPEQNSLIAESKFVSILAGPLRTVIGLSDDEISQLADYFRAQDGRIFYYQLCSIIHGEDPKSNEQSSSNCVLEACPPPPEPQCHQLDQWQMLRLCCLLATIAQREIPMQPYFQDYELVSKNDGRITFAHFQRILDFIGVIVSPEDFSLLVRKFIKDSYTLDYIAFLKAVEAVKKEGIQGLGVEYTNPNAVIDTTLPKLSRPEVEAGRSTAPLGQADIFHPVLRRPRPPRALLECMLRLQQYVMQRRVRLSEFFRDYDPLNCGRIAPENFRRALYQSGLASVLSPTEVDCVTRHYVDPNDGIKICWRTFEDDCDQVFTIKELEKYPEVVPGAAAHYGPNGAAAAVTALGPVGSTADAAGERELDAAQAALLRVRAAVKERAIDLRPAFGDHDKSNNGHVSQEQVRRVLARLGVLPAPAQVRALEHRYLDELGFNFVAMLNDLEERKEESSRPAPPAPAARPPRCAVPDPLESDIVQILAKIKAKMIREGIRPYDFLRQYDKNMELVIPRADFYRGLAASGLTLTPTEMDTLMDVFAAPGRRQYIEYVYFNATVTEGLTQGGLERAPLLQPVPHLPTLDTPLNFLNYEERNIVSKALTKLAKFPDQISNILEVFKDMDKANCGSIPQVSVTRALCQRNLLHLLSTNEREMLFKCFGYQRGCGNEVNYRALSNALDLLYRSGLSNPC